MFYFGSLGRKVATRHSNLDIFVVIPDSMTEPYREKLVPLLQVRSAKRRTAAPWDLSVVYVHTSRSMRSHITHCLTT